MYGPSAAGMQVKNHGSRFCILIKVTGQDTATVGRSEFHHGHGRKGLLL
jgi:hypothetical protein